MANGHRALVLMDKIEAEVGKQISDGLFDMMVYQLDDALARGYRAGRLAQAEEDARIALAQKGKAADIRHNRGPKLSGYYAEDQAEILAEERGEDIAAEIIAAAIRAKAAKIGEGGE